MTSALQDFQQFVSWLNPAAKGTPEDVRRFGNMVLASFSTIAGSSRQYSQRSALLVGMARQLQPTDYLDSRAK